MTLLELIRLHGEGDEVVVWDDTWDMETYFYNECGSVDEWDIAMDMVASKLKVVKDYTRRKTNPGVVVNLYDTVKNSIDNIRKEDLFFFNDNGLLDIPEDDTDFVMSQMMNILAGNVSAKWLVRFADCLKEVK